MNPKIYKALLAVLDYLEDDEKKNWQETGRPANHIYQSIKILRDWIASEGLED
jgi:hypothetical protein